MEGTHSQGEVLAERVTLESVVGKDTTKIRVSREKDAVHVPCLALVPAQTTSSASHAYVGMGRNRAHQSAPRKMLTMDGTGEVSSA